MTTTDDRLAEVKARALRLAEWAEGPGGLFEIFSAVERNYLETLLGSEIENVALREKVYNRVNALRDIRKAMELVIADGASADAIVSKLSRANTGRRK